ERSGDDPAQVTECLPALAERIVAPCDRHIRESFEMYAAARRIPMPCQPRLLCGKADDRGQPTDETIKTAIQHRARRATSVIVRRVAIEPVLAYVEEEGRKVDGEKIV